MAYILLMHPRNRIRELRKQAKLTQDELGRLAGVSQEAISQLENDKRPLTVDWMRTFARIFSVSTVDLLADEDNPNRLTDEEKKLLEAYRTAPTEQQTMIQRVAEPLPEFRHAEEEEAIRRRA